MAEHKQEEKYDKMKGILLPGERKVQFVEKAVPSQVGHGQVLVRTKASSICGSDIRAIYREHLGHGPEGYQNVIAGHEPAGQIVKVGPGVTRFKVGDRVCLYHIAGCMKCWDCRNGYLISCTGSERAAYGWQRDGGHAAFILAEESTCVKLPDFLTYTDGALVACGFGTVYEALTRVKLNGNDSLFIAGLGPIGLAAGLIAKKLGAIQVIGADISESRTKLALACGAIDLAIDSRQDLDIVVNNVKKATSHGQGCEVSIDCSGSCAGRVLALKVTRRWGRSVFVGEGNNVDFDVSQTIIHNQITIYGSWVTSIGHMEDLVEQLARWRLHPELIVTDSFSLDKAEDAYKLMDKGNCGKVVIAFDEELDRLTKLK